MKYINMILLFGLFIVTSINAFCPLCSVVVGAGIGLSQYFGIDDTITGIWLGGLIITLIAWTIYWLNKKNIRFYGRKITVTVVYTLQSL